MGDIGEGTAVDEGWRVLRRLYEVRVEGIAQQHCDGSRHTKVAHTERLAVGSDAQHDVLDTSLQVFLARCQTEDGHQFGSWGNVETCLVHHTVASQSRHDVAQASVVYIEHPLPEDLTQREALLAMLVDIVVEQGTDGVMCRGHGMEVACEVQIDLLHR